MQPKKSSKNTRKHTNASAKQQTQLRLVIAGGAVLLLLSIAAGLIWRDAMNTAANSDDSKSRVAAEPSPEYEALIKESEDDWYEDMSRDQRNAHFWKYTGMTMDEYRRDPRPIEDINNQWEAFNILRSARSFKYSVVIGKDMFASGAIPDGVVKRQFYLSLSIVAKEAQDYDFYSKTFSAFKNAVMSDDSLPDSVKRSTIRLHGG